MTRAERYIATRRARALRAIQELAAAGEASELESRDARDALDDIALVCAAISSALKLRWPR
jgi:hypothetical protein